MEPLRIKQVMNNYGRIKVIVSFDNKDYYYDETNASQLQLNTMYEWGYKKGFGKWLHRQKLDKKAKREI